MPLLNALEKVDGPVVELGMGFVSTPVLHALLVGTKPQRTLLSVEWDPTWVKGLREFQNKWHQFYLVQEIENLKRLLKATKWAVVLVDFALRDKSPEDSYSARIDMVETLRNHAKIIVLHDTEDVRLRTSRWFTVRDTFKYRREFGEETKTTVLSDSERFI